MAGSIKNFIYTDDLGENWAIRADESNVEAVNGAVQDLNTVAAGVNGLPRNIKPRYVEYTNAARTRRIRVVVLNSTLFQGVIEGGVPTIADTIAGGGATLGLIATVGERRKLYAPLDTGLTDGDAD